MISLSHVTKAFDPTEPPAVDDVSFDVRRGETLVLLGSSGCGKTTLLKLMNGLLRPTSGRVEVDGEEVGSQDPISLRRSIGYVFQGIGLFPHMTVEENVGIVPRLLGRPPDERRLRAHELLRVVGLDPAAHAERYPEELSGGQQQRVGVARALGGDPECLLMDEPFGALDALTRDTLQQELIELREELQKTIVFVTHDIFEALTLADRIAVLHEGRLEQIGTGEELLRSPATDFVHRLFARPAEQLAAFGDVL